MKSPINLLIHIVIPVYNRWSYTKNCLENFRQQSYKSYKIIIIDHGSTDGTPEKIKTQFPDVILLRGDESMWWTAATNMGVKYAIKNKAEHVLTINNDVSFGVDYLEQLIKSASENLNSLIGSVSLYKQDKNKIAFLGIKWNKWTAKYKPAIDISLDQKIIRGKYKSIQTDLLPGRGTLIPITAFKEVGMYNEKDFPHYAADEDFSARCVKHGYDLYVATSAIVLIEDSPNQNNVKRQSKWKDLFFSKKSPVNVKTRWNWAKHHGVIPVLYFIFDMLRITYSVVLKR